MQDFFYVMNEIKFEVQELAGREKIERNISLKSLVVSK